MSLDFLRFCNDFHGGTKLKVAPGPVTWTLYRKKLLQGIYMPLRFQL